MDSAQVARLAAAVVETYSPAALETGVDEPTLVTYEDGYRAITLPRDQQPEPLRSLHLLAAVAAGPVLVVAFTWREHDDGTVFVLPLDTRDLDLDLDRDDEIAVTTFLVQHIEHTLGGPRDSWEHTSTLISPRLAVLRPWISGR
jgi:hypothetical protein